MIRDLNKELIEELKARFLHEITERRRQDRIMNEDERQTCNDNYTDQYGIRRCDEAYIEGRDAGYMFALTLFDNVINSITEEVKL